MGFEEELNEAFVKHQNFKIRQIEIPQIDELRFVDANFLQRLRVQRQLLSRTNEDVERLQVRQLSQDLVHQHLHVVGAYREVKYYFFCRFNQFNSVIYYR